MLSTIAGAVTWLIIATKNSWPVSSTHSLVGALAGLGTFLYSSDSINWSNINKLIFSWISSPLLSGIISYMLFYPIYTNILTSHSPLKTVKQYMAFYVGGTVFVMVSFLLVAGPTAIRFSSYV